MIDPGQHLAQMRAAAPLVQNMTNYVAMNVMANVMLAAGASPAMVHAEEEAPEFAAIASALTINIGTFSAPWARAMLKTAAAARAAGRPWVLDPVAVGATSYRREIGAQLLAQRPSVVRGNASEILALSGRAVAGKGADSVDEVASAEAAASRLALNHGMVVAVTGAVDFVTDGTRAVRISNGHDMMPRITALGCSLTGLVGAFVASQPAFGATVATISYFGLAGEIAGRNSSGPASFQVALIDALYSLTPEELDRGARITPA
ncbi:MAG TPA: hydroxyethylthiazole kinase [Paracoccus sp. (in: a-proteobacteria)]|uniref:hydroxyethylthiazole kinase n=1 Tax=uncultured Paracoccus sp. TaxID=189685 RepID=UPI00261DD299|nr:hydroxyethylthiazole kinase [uncultured Paracoccus sp.]HMQ40320.1 hydroxyethylthiazole kinase [Paracoccus sp. (in: a-proteobacteria)]HMR34889.1 hydroxyethylthiazole kinase [Paracoccus sp. (in: a-proteobacteria)]